MAETESSFYKRAAVDGSISSKNCSIIFKDAFLALRKQHRRQKVKKEDSSDIDTSLILVVALGVSTCCLVGFLACVIVKFISEKKNRPTVERVIPDARVPLQSRERRQQKQESQPGPSSESATLTRKNQEVLMTESHFRNYNSV